MTIKEAGQATRPALPLLNHIGKNGGQHPPGKTVKCEDVQQIAACPMSKKEASADRLHLLPYLKG